jgi:carboxylate-amine ligase
VRTVGVEEELLLIQSGQDAVAPVGEVVVAAGAAEDEPVLEREFKQEQVEIGSSPTVDLAELRAELVDLRRAAAEAARAHGARVVAIATSPWKASPRPTPDERYLRMTREFGLLARELLTCGQHVHVSVQSRAEGVAVLDRIRSWLPVLTALSANSPYWQGQDTDYGSFRSVLWGRWPTAGPTELFGDEAGYDQQVEELIRSGGALDDGMIYFDARLSSHYPTVEIRVADVCTDVSDAVLLAALARALVETAARAWRDGEPVRPVRTALLRSASWRAARWAVSGTLLDPGTGAQLPAWTVVNELIELLAPALAASGDRELVAQGLRRLADGGVGADRQRAVFARQGSLDDVVADAQARTLAG